MQAQIQALLTAAKERDTGGPNTRSNVKVAKPPVFSREVGKVGGFIIACRLFLKMKMRVEEQIQWVLSYVQRGLADI